MYKLIYQATSDGNIISARQDVVIEFAARGLRARQTVDEPDCLEVTDVVLGVPSLNDSLKVRVSRIDEDLTIDPQRLARPV